MLSRIEQLIGTSLGTQTMFLIGMVLTVPMTIMFVAELFDYQIRFFPPGIVKMRRRWNAKAVTMMAMTAALSVILQAVSAVLVLIPGFLTFRADALVRFPFGAIFGMPAVWGVGIANLLGDALTGSLSPGSVAGAIVSWWMAYLFYRLYRGPSDYCMAGNISWGQVLRGRTSVVRARIFLSMHEFQLFASLPQHDYLDRNFSGGRLDDLCRRPARATGGACRRPRRRTLRPFPR